MEFVTTIELQGRNTGILVPVEIVQALGNGKKPAVHVRLNGHHYRSTVASMGGRYLIALSAEHRAATGLVGGETVTVDLELDTEPRTVEVPTDLAAALDADPVARATYEKLSYSNQKRHVLAIEAAKAADTRARRIAASVALFHDGKS